MEERDLAERIRSLFEDTVPILNGIYKGFARQKLDLLKESREKFREVLRKRLPGVEKLIGEKDKNDAVKRFLMALPHLQRVALSIDNLIDKMEAKIETGTPLSEKAIDEIKQLMVATGAEFTDIKDYIVTKNPTLKDKIRTDSENVRKLADDFDMIHQNRIITGQCMPKGSLLYLDMTDSLKRMAKELIAFADKI